MTRHVEDVNVYTELAGALRKMGQGVTHYRFPWRDQIVGEGLRQELIAAGVHPSVLVTYYGDTGEVDVALPFDDNGTFASKIEKALDKHKGTEARDHVALVEFSGSVRDAAKRMAEGGEVSAAERDLVIGIAVGRLV